MRNIVVCCDGTGNEYGKNNTNVVETYALARKTATQIAYYDPGVGTGGWAYDEESGRLRALTDQGTGARAAEERQRRLPVPDGGVPGAGGGPHLPVRVQPRRVHRAFARGHAAQGGAAGAERRQPPGVRGQDLQPAAERPRRRRLQGDVQPARSGALHRRLGHGRVAGAERGQALGPTPGSTPTSRSRTTRRRHRRAAQGLPALPVGRSEAAAGADDGAGVVRRRAL